MPRTGLTALEIKNKAVEATMVKMRQVGFDKVRLTDVAKKLGARTIGAISYCLSPVHTDEIYVKTAKELVERGFIEA